MCCIKTHLLHHGALLFPGFLRDLGQRYCKGSKHPSSTLQNVLSNTPIFARLDLGILEDVDDSRSWR